MKKNLLTKIRNRKGFTLAELLIVVAIIGVLVAVSIPIFTAQLAKARLATNQANARAAVASATAEYLTEKDAGYVMVTYDIKTGTSVYASDSSVTQTTVTGSVGSSTVIADWKTTDKVGEVELGKKTFDTWYVVVNSNGVYSIGAN